jgi:Domain of unknown function (DUF3387)
LTIDFITIVLSPPLSLLQRADRRSSQVGNGLEFAGGSAIDWNLKESVRARMKVMVKRLLRKYGYPSDMQALAIELVLEQAKVFTEFEVETSH